MNVRLTLPSAPNERRINESASHIHDLNSVVKQHPANSVSRSRDVRLNAPILFDALEQRLHRFPRTHHDVNDAKATDSLICRHFGDSLAT